MGLSLLGTLMREAGDVVLAELGLVVFLMAAILWLVQMVFRFSMATWAADVRMRTGAVLSTAEALPRGMEQLVHTYMVLAYVATALFGAGILASGLLDAWAGWVAVVAGVSRSVTSENWRFHRIRSTRIGDVVTTDRDTWPTGHGPVNTLPQGPA